MKKLIGRMRASVKLQNKLYECNAADVRSANMTMFESIAIISDLIMLSLAVLSLVSSVYRPMLRIYLTAFIMYTALLLAWHRHKAHISPLAAFYALCTGALCLAIYSSAALMPDYVCVFILIIIQLPYVIVDKPLRIGGLTVLYAAVYLACVVPYKDSRIVMDEVVYVTVFSVVAVVVGSYLRSIRLQNFELKRQAILRETMDFLTQLKNRRSLFLRLDGEGQPPVTAAAMLDIDFFKQFNDTYGHQAGDDALRKIGACFTDIGREHGVCFYRYGGEEFMLLCDKPITSEALMALCDEVNKAVVALQIPHSYSQCGFLTVSIGAVHAQPPQTTEKLIANADTALYIAKAQGRNRAEKY